MGKRKSSPRLSVTFTMLLILLWTVISMIIHGFLTFLMYIDGIKDLILDVVYPLKISFSMVLWSGMKN